MRIYIYNTDDTFIHFNDEEHEDEAAMKFNADDVTNNTSSKVNMSYNMPSMQCSCRTCCRKAATIIRKIAGFVHTPSMYLVWYKQVSVSN